MLCWVSRGCSDKLVAAPSSASKACPLLHSVQFVKCWPKQVETASLHEKRIGSRINRAMNNFFKRPLAATDLNCVMRLLIRFQRSVEFDSLGISAVMLLRSSSSGIKARTCEELTNKSLQMVFWSFGKSNHNLSPYIAQESYHYSFFVSRHRPKTK